jgi:hypothetical protein
VICEHCAAEVENDNAHAAREWGTGNKKWTCAEADWPALLAAKQKELDEYRAMDNARVEGHDAHGKGAGVDDNPYPHSGELAELADAWDTGWFLAEGNKARAQLAASRAQESAFFADQEAMRGRLREVEAGAAVLRQAIGVAVPMVCQAYAEVTASDIDRDVALSCFQRLNSALATDAGKGILAELERLRAALTKLKPTSHAYGCSVYYGGGCTCDYMRIDGIVSDALAGKQEHTP